MDASQPVVARRRRRGRFGRHPDLAVGPGHATRAARLHRPLRRARPAVVGRRPRARPRRAHRHRGASTCPGATAGFDNDYARSATRALASLADRDLFLLHVEATDEAGHQGAVDEKVAALERWDADIIGPLVDALGDEPFRMLLLPDHATPCAARDAHVRAGAVPALRLATRPGPAASTPSAASPDCAPVPGPRPHGAPASR